jgi:hypothetical protein
MDRSRQAGQEITDTQNFLLVHAFVDSPDAFIAALHVAQHVSKGIRDEAQTPVIVQVVAIHGLIPPARTRPYQSHRTWFAIPGTVSWRAVFSDY